MLHSKTERRLSGPRISLILDNKVKGSGGLPLILLPDAISLARDLWTKLVAAEQERNIDSGDWPTVAINSTGGNLASFYLHSLSQLSAADSNHKDIPDTHKHFFSQAIEGVSFTAAMARIVLAAQLTFLASLDEGWAIEHVLPLWTDP